MNLPRTACCHAALVNVPSLGVPSLDRVEPGDPADRYLIQKLEGTVAIGCGTPQGGRFLDQATIDMVKLWITDGAANN